MSHRHLVAGLVALLVIAACDGGAPDAPVAPTPTLRPTPAGSAEDARVVLDAFTSALDDLERGFSVLVAIDYSGTQHGMVRFDVRARGADYTGDLHAEIPGETIDVEVTIVDGVAYARRGDEPWRIVDDYHDPQPVNPFLRLDPDTLEYLGRVELPSGVFHDLRTTAWLGEDPDRTILPDARLTDPLFHVYVREDGAPVEAQLTFTVTGTMQEEAVRIDYLVNYAFSDLGSDVTIVAPDIP